MLFRIRFQILRNPRLRQSSSVMQRRLFNSNLNLIKRQSTSPIGSETNLVPMESIDNNVGQSLTTIWTDQELKTLFDAFFKHGENWRLISKEYFQHRRKLLSIKNKWKLYGTEEGVKLLEGSKHGKYWKLMFKKYFQANQTWNGFVNWTKEEERILKDDVSKHGDDWEFIFKEYFEKPRELESKCNSHLSLPWAKNEIKLLEDSVSKHGKDWKFISKEYFQESRTPLGLCNKWKRTNIWTKVEQVKLEDAVLKHGKDWEFISKEYFETKHSTRKLKSKWKSFFKGRTLGDAVKEYFPVSRTPSSLKHRWERSINYLTEEEVRILQDAVSKHGKDWEYISKEYFQTIKTPRLLENKWNNHWTDDEVRKLGDAVAKHGECWNLISKKYFEASRTISSINHKWVRSIKNLTEEEVRILIYAIKKHGEDWEFISKEYFQMDRTPREISKEYFQMNRSPRELEVKWKTLLKRWTEKEIRKLRDAVSKHGKDWQLISKEYFQANRTVSSLEDKHSRSEEGNMRFDMIKEHGTDQEKIFDLKTNIENQEIYDTKSTNDNYTNMRNQEFYNAVKPYRKRNKHSWTREEEQTLPKLIKNHGIKIAAEMLNRSKRSLYSHYRNKEHYCDSLMNIQEKSNTISKKFQKVSDVGVAKDIETSWIRNLDESSTYKSSLQRCRINWQQLCLQN
ncbi:16644_t:CDS:1 [Funneliformis geosporum]|uniref:1210_t:CDS:1 n=1 Tax=Funneliformis geosporum TaxID=1117311 RepID=A0A9W4WTM1_9GLOM|nr:16644_t:CDS:1 [Funneliformis geosporum]CAI2171251.1 1210_t:CDS:1 [Funneliformis geosporum]